MTGTSLPLLITDQLHFHRFSEIITLNIETHFDHSSFFGLFLFSLHFWLKSGTLKFSSLFLWEFTLNSAIFPSKNALCLVYQIFHRNPILWNRCFHPPSLYGEFQGQLLLRLGFHYIFQVLPSSLQMFLRQKVFQE